MGLITIKNSCYIEEKKGSVLKIQFGTLLLILPLFALLGQGKGSLAETCIFVFFYLDGSFFSGFFFPANDKCQKRTIAFF